MTNMIKGALAAVLIAAGIALTVVLGGYASIAATEEHSAPVAALMHAAFERAAKRNGNSIAVPAGLLTDEGMIAQGAQSFDAMCRGCHTPPGRRESVLARGMNPAPPNFLEIAGHLSPPVSFWVISNGVKMTGMPAFGPTHDADELWPLVAFLASERGRTPEDYAAVTSTSTGSADGHDHEHAQPVEAIVDAASPAHEHDHSSAARGHSAESTATEDDDERAPESAGARLFEALARGDADAVEAMLDENVLIYESGGVESSWAEYASHHLPHDMAFAAKVSKQPLSQKVFDLGRHRVVATRIRVEGEHRGKPIKRTSNETLLLERDGDGWRIVHIHWSSAKAS